jgi:hypothetical protein
LFVNAKGHTATNKRHGAKGFDLFAPFAPYCVMALKRLVFNAL